MFLILGVLAISINPIATEGKCGSRPPLPRIINGQDAPKNSWPWQVSVSMGRAHLCGGTLIRPNWVVTAAHCVYDYPYPQVYEVILGAHQMYGVTSVYQRIQVKRLHVHPGFKDTHLKSDIALLELEKPAILSPKVNTACLPTAADGKVRNGKWCYVTGWGRVFEGSDEAEYLQQASLIVADDQECNKVNSPLLAVDAKSMLCAGYRDKGGCQGDSGGPLVCEEQGRWVLRGVVSWGSGDCSTKYFTVFARVRNYEKWINDILSGTGCTCGNGGASGGGSTTTASSIPTTIPTDGGHGGQSCEEVSPWRCKDLKGRDYCRLPSVRKICPKTCGDC